MKLKPWIGLCRSVVWPRVVGAIVTILAALSEGSHDR